MIASETIPPLIDYFLSWTDGDDVVRGISESITDPAILVQFEDGSAVRVTVEDVRAQSGASTPTDGNPEET